MLLASLLVKDFLKSCSIGRPTLNVLIATVGMKGPDIGIGPWKKYGHKMLGALSEKKYLLS